MGPLQLRMYRREIASLQRAKQAEETAFQAQVKRQREGQEASPILGQKIAAARAAQKRAAAEAKAIKKIPRFEDSRQLKTRMRGVEALKALEV